MKLALLLSGIFLGVLTSYSITVAARGGIEDRNPVTIIIGFISMISLFAIVIWGFFEFSWWVPIVSFIGLSLVVGPMVGRQSWAVFYKASPFTGLLTIGLTIAAWLT